MFNFKLALPFLLVLLILPATIVSAFTLDDPRKRSTMAQFVPYIGSIKANNDKIKCVRAKWERGRLYSYFTFTYVNPKPKGNDDKFNSIQFLTWSNDKNKKVVFILFLKGNKPVRSENAKGYCSVTLPSIIGGPQKYYMSCTATAGDVKFSAQAFTKDQASTK